MVTWSEEKLCKRPSTVCQSKPPAPETDTNDPSFKPTQLQPPFKFPHIKKRKVIKLVCTQEHTIQTYHANC